MKTQRTLSVAIVAAIGLWLIWPAGLAPAALYDDFETNHTGPGDTNGISGALWTVTNNAWKRSTVAPGGQTAPANGAQGTAWAQSFVTGDGDTGTLTSNSFTLDGNLLRMKLTGFGGNGLGDFNFAVANTKMGVMNVKWELFRTSDNKLLSQGTGPFQNGLFKEFSVDTSDYVGEDAYLKLTDNATGAYGWMGIDHVRTDSRADTSVFTLEIGDDQGDWSLSAGSSFDYSAVLNVHSPHRHPYEGGEYLRSHDPLAGTAKSPDFTITRNKLEFYSAGFGPADPGAGTNLIKLYRASDDALLHTWGDDEALGGDGWAAHRYDVTALAGQNVYLVLEDNIAGGYGWVGIDDVRLTGTHDDFETNHTGAGDTNGISGALWTVTNNGWKRSTTAPGGQTAPANGAEGTAWAQSFVTGDGDTGTLTSTPIHLDGNLLRMKLTAFGGNDYGEQRFSLSDSKMSAMNCKWELFRASDDKVLSQGTGPFQDGVFKEFTIDVSDYAGQDVYLKVTDNDIRAYGWMGIDYVRTDSRDATSVFTLEVGDDQTHWVRTGSFDYYALLQWPADLTDRHPREGGEFLRSGDTSIGTATSPDFLVTRETLEFYTAGFGELDHSGATNRIELYRASDDQLLHTWGDDEVLGGDAFAAQSLDVSAWALRNVYLVLEDNIDGGWGWVGIDDIRLTGANMIPEPATITLLGLGLAGLVLCRLGRRRRRRGE